jgi:uncharacterized low-complexity protein
MQYRLGRALTELSIFLLKTKEQSMKSKLNPIASALGITLAATIAATPIAQADQNPFGVSEMSSGYMLAAHEEGHKDKEGKCGEGKCGEGKCGEGKDKDKEGKCGEGKCGEGKCGEDKAKDKEGKCGEGKCGEGKCGEKK